MKQSLIKKLFAIRFKSPHSGDEFSRLFYGKSLKDAANAAKDWLKKIQKLTKEGYNDVCISSVCEVREHWMFSCSEIQYKYSDEF